MSGEELRAALDILDVIDGIVDDTHPEGHGCPLCVALTDLRAALAAPSTPEPSGLPFTVEVLHDELRDVLLAHGVRPFSKALAYDLYVNLIEAAEDTAELRAALAAPSTPEPSEPHWTPDFYEGFRFEGPFEDGSYGVTVPLPDGRKVAAAGESIADAVVNVAAAIDILRAAPSTEPALDVVVRGVGGNDSGGGYISVLVDRDAEEYPDPGARVEVRFARLAESQS